MKHKDNSEQVNGSDVGGSGFAVFSIPISAFLSRNPQAHVKKYFNKD
jgi:hypothetical protein